MRLDISQCGNKFCYQETAVLQTGYLLTLDRKSSSLISLHPHLPHPPHPVEAEEIRRLSKSFKKLDLNQDGSLSADEFLSIPELQQNPLVRRVIDILDTDRNGEVDFQGGFVQEMFKCLQCYKLNQFLWECF